LKSQARRYLIQDVTVLAAVIFFICCFEKQKFKDVIDSATAFDSDFSEFVAGAGMSDAFANFGDTKMRITLGSSAVDYTTPTAPVFNAAVGFGGRGVSIYRASDMTLVWDSGSDFEKKTVQCLSMGAQCYSGRGVLAKDWCWQRSLCIVGRIEQTCRNNFRDERSQ